MRKGQRFGMSGTCPYGIEVGVADYRIHRHSNSNGTWHDFVHGRIK